MRVHKVILTMVFILFLFSLFTFKVFSLEQLTYTLDLYDLKFKYKETYFNDSLESVNFVYLNDENKTLTIRIPKNSTILNSSLLLTGKITPTMGVAPGQITRRIVVDNVTLDGQNEIVVGGYNYLVLLNSSLDVLKTKNIGGETFNEIAVGDIREDPGKEIAVATLSPPYLVILNSTLDVISPPLINQEVKSVAIGDLFPDIGEEIIAAFGNNVSVFNSTWNLKVFYNTGGSVYSVAVGDVIKGDFNEIVVGESGTGKLYLLDSNTSLIQEYYVGESTTIQSIAIGGLRDDEGEEIAVGTASGRVIILNSSLELKGDYNVGSLINDISIGDVTSDPLNEIAVALENNKVLVLNSTGSFVWEYTATDSVKGVSIGDVTSDPLNETAIVTTPTDNRVLILNFEYFPTNVKIDVGNDGNYDWSYSLEKLRGDVWLNDSLDYAIQSYLSSCPSKVCYVPLVFHSDSAGELEVSNLNLTYEYDASDSISYELVDEWSRATNIHVNESVGNVSWRITYSEPANDILIKYVRVSGAASRCDFDDKKFFEVFDKNGVRYCNVSSGNTVMQSSTNGIIRLWDDSMTASIPIFMGETDYFPAGGDYQYKNLTIWAVSNPSFEFYDVIAETVVNESYIKSNENLTVFWNGGWCDITPSSSVEDCDSSNPTFETIQCGSDTFYVCKQDINGNNIIDFFKWKQPRLTAGDSTHYILKGSGNMLPILENISVIPASAIWGSLFNFSVDVFDSERDNVTVQLYLCLPLLDTCQFMSERIIEGNGTVFFEIQSNKSWVGQPEFYFVYWDSSGGEQRHDPMSTSRTPFEVLRHSVIIQHIQGDGAPVNRTGTGNEVTFIVKVNDTSNSSLSVIGANCYFWVTSEGTWKLAGKTKTNSSGYCNFTFKPNSSFKAGAQWWKAGVFNDSYYEDANSTNFTVNIYGFLNINFMQKGQQVVRNERVILLANLYDEFGSRVEEEGYTCNWYIGSNNVGSTLTNSSGICTIDLTTSFGCDKNLGNYSITVNTSSLPSSFYYLNKSSDSGIITLADRLHLNILAPSQNSKFHDNETVMLNSSVSDNCFSIPSYPYNVTWDVKCDCNSLTLKLSGEHSSFVPLKDVSCSASSIDITATGSGSHYISDQKNIKIFSYGWSAVNLSQPTNITIKRVEGIENKVKIVCEVKNINQPSKDMSNYPVNFWDIYLSEVDKTPIQTNFLGSNMTIDDVSSMMWDVTYNESVPAGLHLIKCNISNSTSSPPGYYDPAIPESTHEVYIMDMDLTPPRFDSIFANSTEPGGDVLIEVNLTDYGKVDKVWINVSYPNGTHMGTFFMQNTTPDMVHPTFVYTIPGLTEVGDYDFTIFANDTAGNLANTSYWFEVYLPLQLILNTTNYFGENVPIELLFYRNSTDWLIHDFKTTTSNGYYTFWIHKRVYDLKVKVLGDEVVFLNLDTRNETLLIDPLKITKINLTHLDPPTPCRNELEALYVKANFSYEKGVVYLSYPEDQVDWESETSITIFKCSDWVWSDTPFCNSSWIELVNRTLHPKENKVSANVSEFSAFYALEKEVCGNGICGYGESPVNCPQDCGELPEEGGGGEGTGTGAGGGRKSFCGNGICEPGENSENCPEDCGILFSLWSNLTQVQLEIGETQNYILKIINNVNFDLEASVSVVGMIRDFVDLEKSTVKATAKNETIVKMKVTIPEDTTPGTYTGEIVVSAGGETRSIPVSIVVSLKGSAYIDVVVTALNEKFDLNDTAKFHVILYNLGFRKRLEVELTYLIRDLKTEKVVFEEKEKKMLETSISFTKKIPLSPLNISIGRYSFEVQVKYDDRVASASDEFDVVQIFWTPERVKKTAIGVMTVASVGLMFYGRKRYIKWKLSKARYIFPVDMRKLPKGKLWLGKIAETKTKAYFNMDDLTTHVLTAGATGSGKSVSAMIFVEELLKQKIPVVVFDPTAQWTGFVRACRDPKMLRFYKAFGLSRMDARSFNGLIYEVTTPNVKIDFKKYMNPGEITVFTLNKLKPGEYDDAVRNIVDTIFAQGWEESPHLRLVIVFDEVHRLLEKYGGKGGYVALERACREFRKWGIGLIMISQVLSDFKEAIKGNVLTEVQLHTKSLGDLNRIEKKYGVEYAKKVTKLEVGVGMMQNPKYNDGKPWFVSFRPTLHEPHKLPDQELKLYQEYASILDKFEKKLEEMEKAGKDVFDLKTELRLARDKLKRGRFRMAKIYIDSLSKHLSEG